MADEILSFDIMQIMEMIPHHNFFFLVDRIIIFFPVIYTKKYKYLTMN